jgi:TIR domain/FHA domain
MDPLVPIAALALAPDASWAISVTRDGTIRTLGTGAEPRVLPCAVPLDGSQPVAVALTDHRLIRVIWAAEDSLGLYQSADGDEPRLETFAVQAPIRALGLSPSGRIAIVGCADGTLLTLDVVTGEFGRRVSIGLIPAGALAVAADDGPVVASLTDNSLRRFNLATGIAYVIDSGLTIRHVAITPDGNIVLAYGTAGLLYRWDVSHDRKPRLLDLSADATALAADRDAEKVLVGTPDGKLWLHDLTGGQPTEFAQPESAANPKSAAPAALDSPAPAALDSPATVVLPARQATASPPGPVPGLPPGPDYGGIVDDDVGFTVYRPRFLVPRVWGTLLVFAHKTGPVVDPDLGPIDPVEVVRARAEAHFGENAAPPARVDARSGLFRGARLRIVPDLPGIEFNPPEEELAWWEPVHEVSFRLRADAALIGSSVRGAVRIWCGPLLIGEVTLAITVRTAGAADDQSVAERAPRYRKIFPSYSHQDRAIVEGFEDAARALGDQYLLDVLALRAGERWQPRILELIAEADVFQLFWSSNSMRSQYCRQEWEHALALRRSAFVRPLYWEDPLPEDMAQGLPPADLREIHFVRVRSSRQPPARSITQAVTQPPAADPVLVVQVKGTSHELRAGSSYRVGRDPQSDIVISDPRVSWVHAVLGAERGTWFIEDLGSMNGIFAGSQRIDRYRITEQCTLRLANATDGPAMICVPSRPASLPPPSTVVTPRPDPQPDVRPSEPDEPAREPVREPAREPDFTGAWAPAPESETGYAIIWDPAPAASQAPAEPPQPDPAQAYQPGSGAGYQPGPEAGHQPGLPQGYQPGDWAAYRPGPAESDQPGPAASYRPGPAQGYQPPSTPSRRNSRALYATAAVVAFAAAVIAIILIILH